MGGWGDGSMGMDRWIDGWVDSWVGGWMGGWMDGWVGGWMDGRPDGLMDGWIDGWMDGLFKGITLHTWLGSVNEVRQLTSNLKQIPCSIALLAVGRNTVHVVVSSGIFVSPTFSSELDSKRNVVVFLCFDSTSFKVGSEPGLLKLFLVQKTHVLEIVS